MIHLPASVRVYLCLTACDMRKSFDSLHALVREHLELDAFAGHLFVFASRRHRVKILYWDQDGFAIWSKRLEEGTYAVLSISQISETLFILTIPFFLQRLGIKKVMLISIFAWVFRFGLFAVGDPGARLWMLVVSMIIYGMAFDFFNISGSLFVEREAEANICASAQGLFMIMTNGLGAFVGGRASGWVVDHFTVEGVKDWHSIWFTFAAYTLVLGLVFPLVLNYRHHPENIG